MTQSWNYEDASVIAFKIDGESFRKAAIKYWFSKMWLSIENYISLKHHVCIGMPTKNTFLRQGTLRECIYLSSVLFDQYKPFVKIWNVYDSLISTLIEFFEILTVNQGPRTKAEESVWSLDLCWNSSIMPLLTGDSHANSLSNEAVTSCTPIDPTSKSNGKFIDRQCGLLIDIIL